MKLGIFGGTFNPIHYGHLINAELIRERFGLGTVLFIPAKKPVHKGYDTSVSADHRYAMVKAAISDNPFFDVSDMEITREQDSYTIYTVQELLQRYVSRELYLIIGQDSYDELDTWKDYRDLLDRVDVIVMNRFTDFSVNKALEHMSEKIHVAQNPVIDITSTDIRTRVREKKTIKYLTPDTVISYIDRMELYKD